MFFNELLYMCNNNDIGIPISFININIKFCHIINCEKKHINKNSNINFVILLLAIFFS